MSDAARLLETMPDGILLVATDGTISYANGVAARLSGYSAEYLVGRSVDMLVPSGLRDQHAGLRDRFAHAHLSRTMGSGLDIHLERADASLLAVDVALSWMDDEVVVAFRDATDERRAASEVRRARERLAAINDVNAAILTGRTLNEVLTILAERARWLADADAALVLLGDDRGARVTAAAGANDAVGRELSEDALLTTVMASGEIDVIDDIRMDPRCVHARDLLPEVGPAVIVPLGTGAGEGGAILVGREHGAFDQDEVSVLVTFAAQAAVAVERAQLLEDRHRLAVMDERDRIARDLHDGVIQSLFAVGLGLSAGKGAPEPATVERSIDAIDAVIRELRNYIFGLGTGRDHADRSLAILLTDLARQMSIPGGSVIDVEINPAVAAAAAGKAGGLLFAAREALSNAVQHAGASTITLTMELDDGHGVLEVRDDGTGFDPGTPRPGGQGIANLRARADALGGSLNIESSSSGSRIRLRFPI